MVWLIWKTVISPQAVTPVPSAELAGCVVGRVVVEHQQVVARSIGNQT